MTKAKLSSFIKRDIKKLEAEILANKSKKLSEVADTYLRTRKATLKEILAKL